MHTIAVVQTGLNLRLPSPWSARNAIRQHPFASTTDIPVGEKKLATVACTTPIKPTSRLASSSAAAPATTRKLNENKLLSSKSSANRALLASYITHVCKLCKGRLHQAGARYCQACAYKRGVCAMCGVVMLDVTGYKQSLV